MEEGDSMATVELKKNGANIPVTRDNRSVFFFLSCYECMKYTVSVPIPVYS